MIQRRKTLRIAILAALAALPLVIGTTAHRSSQVLPGAAVNAPPVIPREDLRKKARAYRPTIMQDRRIYMQYREKCHDRANADSAFVCPDYHDKKAMRAFLMDEETLKASAHAAAAASSGATVLRASDLSGTDQSLLRRYRNAHTCPVSLKDYTPGFYELCRQTISDTTSRAERRGVPKEVEKRFGFQRKLREERRAERLERMKAKP